MTTIPARVFGATGSIVGAVPFDVAIAQSKLDAISARVEAAELPAPLGQGDWSLGVDGTYLTSLRHSWLSAYHWRPAERAMNRHPQFIAEVEGQMIDFYHVPGKRASGAPPPRPVMIIHGWPYSRFSLVDLIDRLTDPARFGGDPRSALTIIAPSLPGSGFSSHMASAPTIRDVARRYHQLMTQTLGYRRYGLQGGDHGHVIATFMAYDYPDAVAGLHLSMIPTPPASAQQQTPDVAAWTAAKDAFIAANFSYFRQQADRPASIAYAMADSPIGLAAWFVDKFHAWTDLASAGGDLDTALGELHDPALGRQRILTEIMTYLVSDSVASSIWFYNTFRNPGGSTFYPGGRIMVPTAAFLPQREFPNGRPPRAFAERFFHLVRYTEVPHGAHFPFWEIPTPFGADITGFFATLPT